MLMTLIIDEGLSPEMNTIQKFVAEAQAYENSVKTAVYYVGHSYHCTMKSRIVAHTWVGDAGYKEVVKGALALLKPQLAILTVTGVPWSTPQDHAGAKPAPANSKGLTSKAS